MNEHLVHHVYLLRSDKCPDNYYKGYTRNINKRLSEHNQGKVKSTTAHKPWHLQTVISFNFEEKAHQFEQYLKSHSGRAFSSKHF